MLNLPVYKTTIVIGNGVMINALAMNSTQTDYTFIIDLEERKNDTFENNFYL